MNKRISAALCTMTAMAAVLAVPTAAQAADPYAKGFSTSAGDERVVVFFDTLERPKGLKVILRRKGGSAPVATLTSFTPHIKDEDFCEPSCGDVLPRPLKAEVPRLPELGEYSVDVQYTGTMGETVLHKDRATLNYRVRPYFENLKAANGVSFTSRDTVVSGDIKAYDPRTGTAKPFTGAFTATTGTVTTPLTADAKGHFQSGLTVSGAAGSEEPGSATTDVRFTAALPGITKDALLGVPVTPVTAHIALDSPKLTGSFGTESKVSGTVTWKAPDGTWKPVPAGAAVGLGFHGGTGTTDGAGRFTALGRFAGDFVWEAESLTPWLDAEPATLSVDTTPGFTTSHLSAEIDSARKLTVRSWFTWGELPAGVTRLRMDVQTSADGKTGWTTRTDLGVTTRPGSNGADAAETTFSNPGTGFVRLRYAGSPDIHAPEPAALAIPRRTETAITDFNAAPEPVKKGKPITVSGKLTQAVPTWKPYTGGLVQYWFRATGATYWKSMGSSKSTAGGAFSRTFTARENGVWKAHFVADTPDTTHFNSPYSREDEVLVTP
ncbi:hypothetical protein [Streptomyces sp. NPDC051546]|uniref:hypothetical protein n=1 Tax=Streptomyces sp. NPDC051546 TaxID=3365655 RepID=UPI00379A85E4